MIKFSIVIPTWNRVQDGKLHRCLNSVVTQTYAGDFQAIIVDDGSKDKTEVKDLVESYEDERLKCVRIKHSGRVIARNTGMKEATGDFICWLDSDDCYNPEYLNTFAYHIRKNPEVKLWVCGSCVFGMIKEPDHICPKWTKIRPAWKPKEDPEGPGHLHFRSGKVGTGMFVFARECLEKTGLMPPWINHEQIANGVSKWMGYDTGYNAATRLCGNPHGEDWAMHRRLTQFYRQHNIEAALYMQYVR